MAARIKVDLRERFARGERPAVAEYLEKFPGLRSVPERIVSLIYEEYCLREECGEAPDAEAFCDRYASWRDSVASQIRYHEVFSQLVGPPGPAPLFPQPGDRFRGFHLRSELGRGGAARVFLARDQDLGDREVALKITPDRGDEPSIQGRLDHPHIVPVLSVARELETGLRGLCMPYWPGRALDAVIDRIDFSAMPRGAAVLWQAVAGKQGGGESPGPGWAGFPMRGSFHEGVAWLGAVLAEALDHAHTRGIVHRDVKPANILLTIRGGPLLLDFNLAQAPHAPDRAEAALRGGTLPYMAPEQLAAFLDSTHWNRVGPAADLYSLGLVLRELLTGLRPGAPDPSLPLPRALAELADERSVAPASARCSNPTVPYALDAIVSRCLQPRPHDRYGSARQLALDLRRYLERRPLLDMVNPSRTEAIGIWARRNRWWLTGVAGAMAIALALFAWDRARDTITSVEYLDLGAAAVARDRLGDAIAFYERARTIEPRDYKPYLGLGLVAIRQRNHELSLSYFDHAVHLAESMRPPLRRSWLAGVYSQRGRARFLYGNALQGDESRQYQALKKAGHRAPGSMMPPESKADRYYLGGLDDVSRATTASHDGQVQLECSLVRCHCEEGLGDTASRRDRYDDACPHYARAEKEARSILLLYPGNKEGEALLADIRMRREVDCKGR
jgi:serine/threonine protein kinase